MIKLLFILWGGGFCLFILWSERLPHVEKTQAAVVFTGRGARLQEALRLLRARKVEEIFISGVNPKTSLKMLQSHYGFKSQDPITLGYDARNTAQNAIETAKWADKNKIYAFRLITDSEHMARSLLEMQKHTRALILPHPIQPKNRRYRVLFGEYHKCLLAVVLSGIQHFSKKFQYPSNH